MTEALTMSNWVQKDAAELLQITPRVMNYKISRRSGSIYRVRGARWRRASRVGVLRSGVALLVERHQLGGANVGVALGRGKPRVSQEFLNRAKVGPTFEHVGRE